MNKGLYRKLIASLQMPDYCSGCFKVKCALERIFAELHKL